MWVMMNGLGHDYAAKLFRAVLLASVLCCWFQVDIVQKVQ